MKKLSYLAIGAALVAGAFSLSAPASARIVCNDDGDCWHAHDGLAIAPGVRLNVHPDDWRFSQDDHSHRWREHEGNGYWHGHDWVDQR